MGINKILVWERNYEDTQTIEVLRFNSKKNLFNIESIVNGILNGQPTSIEYFIKIDKNWKVKEVRIKTLIREDNPIVLKSGIDKRWYDEMNNEIPELKGCIDIDISLTPFTNTLPIKRLGDSLLKRTKLNVLYLNLADWKFEKVEQYYTKLSNNLYKYEGVFRGFTAELPVDNFGFVTTYPNLFERVYPE
jgi:hypothetical protein